MNQRFWRRGMATIVGLLMLSMLGIIGMSVASQWAITRRGVDAREVRVQALWLARSGQDIALAKLRANAEGYAGETLEPVPGSEVRVEVKPDGAEGQFRVAARVRYQPQGQRPVELVRTRVVRKAGGKWEVVGVER